jgi:hypothetical protein
MTLTATLKRKRDADLAIKLPRLSSSSYKTGQCGGDKEIRTPDLFIANEPLYQLSYIPVLLAFGDGRLSRAVFAES